MLDLPRTGIEYPFMRDRPQFITEHPEYEKLAEPPAPSKVEEYTLRETEKLSSGQSKVVYDYCEMSPFYVPDPTAFGSSSLSEQTTANSTQIN